MEFEVGQRARRVRDGSVGTVQRAYLATSVNGSRFPVIVVGGVVRLPREYEPVTTTDPEGNDT